MPERVPETRATPNPTRYTNSEPSPLETMSDTLEGTDIYARSEHAEQKALFQWAHAQGGAIPELRLMFAIPNGGHRHKAVAGKMKAEGVKAGIPDVFLPVPRGPYHGLFVEMKKEKGRTTAVQNEWISALIFKGYCVEVCRGFDEARKSITEYLEL